MTDKTLKSKHNRYPREDGRYCIDVRIKNARQLFDMRDPSPFLERDLDEEFEDYILSSVEELGPKAKLKIRIQEIENSDPELTTKIIKGSIRSYFEYRLRQRQKSNQYPTSTYEALTRNPAIWKNFNYLWFCDFPVFSWFKVTYRQFS